MAASQHFFVLMIEKRSLRHMLGVTRIGGTDAVSGLGATVEGLTVPRVMLVLKYPACSDLRVRLRS